MQITDVSTQGVNQASSSANYELGDYYYDSDGFKYIYSQANEALSAHQVLTIDEDALSVNAVVTGVSTTNYKGRNYDGKSTLTKTGAFTSDDLYAGYRGVVTEGPAKGETFIIDHNSANVLYLKDPLTNIGYQIKAFKLNLVEANPIGTARAPVGITPIDVTTQYYFWRQVSGIAEVLTQESTSGSTGYGLFTGGGIKGSARIGRPQSWGDESLVGSVILGSGANSKSCWAKLVMLG